MTDIQTTATKTVLLIEDDLFLSQLLFTRMSRAGINVVKAMDGQDAFEKLISISPDLVLTDIILPKKSGFEIMEELANTDVVKPPIIVISNLGQDADIARAKELGAVGYYIKAKISIEDLINKIKVYFETPEKVVW